MAVKKGRKTARGTSKKRGPRDCSSTPSLSFMLCNRRRPSGPRTDEAFLKTFLEGGKEKWSDEKIARGKLKPILEAIVTRFLPASLGVGVRKNLKRAVLW